MVLKKNARIIQQWCVDVKTYMYIESWPSSIQWNHSNVFVGFWGPS
jgi:hypothetical protein